MHRAYWNNGPLGITMEPDEYLDGNTSAHPACSNAEHMAALALVSETLIDADFYDAGFIRFCPFCGQSIGTDVSGLRKPDGH